MVGYGVGPLALGQASGHLIISDPCRISGFERAPVEREATHGICPTPKHPKSGEADFNIQYARLKCVERELLTVAANWRLTETDFVILRGPNISSPCQSSAKVAMGALAAGCPTQEGSLLGRPRFQIVNYTLRRPRQPLQLSWRWRCETRLLSALLLKVFNFYIVV